MDDARQDCVGVQALPVELLHAIFLNISNEPDPCWKTTEDASYNHARAVAPYRLSAVCQYWRRVALSSPGLWNYVALPPWDPRRSDASHAYVGCQLERSRSRGLTVLLIYDEKDDEDSPFEILNHLSWFMDILNMVIKQAAHWQRVKIICPPHIEFTELMAGRRLQALEEFCLGASAATARNYRSESRELQAPWLENAPSLRWLGVQNIPLHLPSVLSSVQLASFHPLNEGCYDELWNSLGQLPSLRGLNLQLEHEPDDFVEPVQLPALESLTARGRSPERVEDIVVHHIIAPKLSMLRVEHSGVPYEPIWGPAYAAAFPNIVDLEIVGAQSFSCVYALHLRALERVRRVKFIDCVFPLSTSGSSDSNFFTRLDSDGFEPSRLVWPGLDSLIIILPDRTTMGLHRFGDDDMLRRLAFFVRARAEHCARRDTQFKISLSSWPWPFPSWFRLVLGKLLGSANVYLSTADGSIHSVFPDDDSVGEDEAQFTDEDASDSDLSSAGVGDDASTELNEAGHGTKRWGPLQFNGPDWESDSDDSDYVYTESE